MLVHPKMFWDVVIFLHLSLGQFGFVLSDANEPTLTISKFLKLLLCQKLSLKEKLMLI